MSEPVTPTPETPVVETPPSVPSSAPQIINGVETYTSSEEFQRVHAAGLAKKEADEKAQKATTDKQKLRLVLDKYITKYSKTTEVRKMAAAHKKSADHQLDVCAEVVEILEKIKNELR